MSDQPEPGRRLAAVWFADIVGYTALSSKDEDGALKVVAAFQRVAEEVVAQHSGRVVKYIGDAALAEFASVDGAIRSALTLLERFIDDEDVRRFGSTLRVGVNVGEVITSPDGDIYGDGVNLASRLQNQAEPGQVIASDAVHAQIRQRPVFHTEALGQRAVKGIADPVTLYAVTLQQAGDGVVTTQVPKKGPKKAAAGRRSRKPLWIGGVAVLVVATWVALANPGGVASRFVPGAAVAVVRATYPVVEGGMEVGGTLNVVFTGAIEPATATSGNIQLLDARGEAVAAEVSLAADQRAATLRPRETLAYGVGYTLLVSPELRDTHGRGVRNPEGTEDGTRFSLRTQPIPAGTPPAGVELAGTVTVGADVRLRFSEPVDAHTVEGGLHLAGTEGNPLAAGVELARDGLTATLRPEEPLTTGATYVVRIDSTVMARSGLPLEPDSLDFQVAAAQAVTRPTATNTQPSSAGEAAPPSRGTGPATLNLRVSQAAARPFLKVVVDGDTLGPPPVSGYQLAPGRRHDLAIVGTPDLSAYTLVVFQREVTPQPGQVLDIGAEITAFGSIDVVSQPSGTVFVDGRQVGRTPLAGYPVTAGVVHRLEIRPTAAEAGRFAPFSGEFRVEPLEWKSLGRLALPPIG